MAVRRRTSRQVALTATFLALAAGGVAACDVSTTEDGDPFDPSYQSGVDDYSGGSSDGSYVDDGGEVTLDETETDEVFYCADAQGKIVDDDLCGGGTSTYYLWHSSGYARGLAPGTKLAGGARFKASDRRARATYHLPAAGKVGNGTVKTNVVGSRSTGSGTSTRSGSGSTSGSSSSSGSDAGSGSGSSGG